MQIYIKLLLGLLFILSLVIFFNAEQFQLENVYLSVVPIYIIMLLVFYIGRLINKYKEMELDFNTILDHSNDFFYMKDTQYRFRAVNDNFAKLTGHQHWSEIAGKNDFDVFPKEDAQKYRNDDENVIERGEKVLGRVESYPMDDGTVGWVKSSKIPIVDEDGKVIRMFGLSTDVTELVRIKENLEVKVEEEILLRREKEKALIQQSKMAAMGEMIGNIAHQWRQPLSVISAQAANVKIEYELNDKISNELSLEFADSVLAQSKYLSDTIDDFRSFFNPNSEDEEYNLKEYLDKCTKLVSASFDSNMISIIHDIDEKINSYGDKNKLLQAVINILNNARDALVDASDLREKLIFMFTAKEDENNNIVIIIKDNAGGIPEKILPRIFEPYFTTKHKAEGTGLGLYMTYSIVTNNLKGTIKAENEVFEYEGVSYKGAKFTITLPTNKENFSKS